MRVYSKPGTCTPAGRSFMTTHMQSTIDTSLSELARARSCVERRCLYLAWCDPMNLEALSPEPTRVT